MSEHARRDVPRRVRWTRGRVALLAAAVLAVIALVAGLVLMNALRTPPAPATEVVRVTRADQTTTVTLSGTLSPQTQANASFAVPGTVRTIDVKIGQQVAAGATLATVDDRDLGNAVALAEANLTAARAQVQTIRDTSSATSAQIAAANAQVEAMQASLDNARKRLADATLTSPIDGVVAQVSIEVGDQVSGAAGSLAGTASGSNPFGGLGLPTGVTGQAASGTTTGAQVVVVSPDAWKLDATIGTVDLPALRTGQLAVVTPTGTDTHVTAVVDTVGVVATSSGGAAATFPVTLKITQAGVQLFSGSDADAIVTTDTVEDVLTIPNEAVTYADTVTTVTRPGGTTTEVALGRRFAGRVEVTAGLAEGDEVVVPVGVAVTAPARPQFGPNGTLASPDPTATPSR